MVFRRSILFCLGQTCPLNIALWQRQIIVEEEEEEGKGEGAGEGEGEAEEAAAKHKTNSIFWNKILVIFEGISSADKTAPVWTVKQESSTQYTLVVPYIYIYKISLIEMRHQLWTVVAKIAVLYLLSEPNYCPIPTSIFSDLTFNISAAGK